MHRRRPPEAAPSTSRFPRIASLAALAVTLASLAAQTVPLRVVVSDQTEGAHAADAGEVRAVARVLQHRGHEVEFHASAEAIAPWLADPRITLLRHDRNRGLDASLNTALDATQAPLVA